jgi:two-component system LytT family sensor kinase
MVMAKDTIKILKQGRLARYVLHICFWIIIYLFFIYLKKPLLGLPYNRAALVTVKDVVVIAVIFYFISYYIVPELLLKRRFLLLLLSASLVYYFYAITLYLDFIFLSKLIEIPGRGYHAYADRILSSGLSGIFLFKNVAEILLDLSYLLSPALIIKLLVGLSNMRTQAIELQRDNLNLELAFLRSQINPHFLFNTLNNVYSLALHKSDKTADVILKLSDLMRYTLYESNTPMILLREEITFLRNYIELESIRHSSKVKITFQINGDYENLLIAPLIIFSFIENAFKHGINTSIGSSWVEIRFDVENEVLYASISNSKFVPRPSRRPLGGIGIANAKKRLALLYDGAHVLNINQTDSLFNVYLSINLNDTSAKKLRPGFN